MRLDAVDSVVGRSKAKLILQERLLSPSGGKEGEVVPSEGTLVPGAVCVLSRYCEIQSQ